jgi:hypothetical protein
MNARDRRSIEMGQRALAFARQHPDESPGYAAAVSFLATSLARAEELAARQRNGLLQERAAVAVKRELRQRLIDGHLEHLEQVGQMAAGEAPALRQQLTLRPGARPFLAFRTSARGMFETATANKEVLVRHGMVESVLADAGVVLAQFDAAVEQGSEGRRAHVGASADLSKVALDVVKVVRILDSLNNVRMAGDAELLAAWRSASSVTAAPVKSVAKPGEEQPAA